MTNNAGTSSADSADIPRFAEVTTDPVASARLAVDRPNAWEWALFASTLLQRRDALDVQRRDHRLGYAERSGDRIRDVQGLANLVKDTVDRVPAICKELQDFLLTPAFADAFGERHEDSADPDGVLYNANRVMDTYEELLALAARIRGTRAPSTFRDVLKDTSRLVDKPLNGFDTCIDDYARLVEGLPARLITGEDVDEGVQLTMHMDNDLAARIIKKLNREIRRAA
ncbi:hypothetical protein [Williamsia muralis]|uniref:Uncharacterized protein n=1 Tax=Williamsia marianensis TaxID=85044 RepID=A0ABU4EVZ1_WILMA|nr:hypothetical protein [Williamsia muralis]MDV7135412.1 hypothetical protein [Williamsia muralis]